MSDRRYTEAELHAIFERAARRHENAMRAEEAASGGLTLEELQRIGAAAGIDPAHIAAAASDLEMVEEPIPTILGTPTEVRTARVLPGPVSDEAWERMVAELRRHFKDTGTAGQVGRLREWSTNTTTSSSQSPVRVILEPDDNGAQLRIERSLEMGLHSMHVVSGALLAFALIFGVVVATKNPAALALTVVLAILSMVSFGGTQFGYRQYASSQTNRFETLLDRLELIAHGTQPKPGRATSTASARTTPQPAPVILPDEDNGEADGEEALRPRRRTRS